MGQGPGHGLGDTVGGATSGDPARVLRTVASSPSA